MAKFDPAAFENTVIENANETKTTPLPEGEYECFIKGLKVNSWTDPDGQERPVLDVTYQVYDHDPNYEKVSKELNRDVLTVGQRIFLDVTPEGGLAFGPNQNVQLGRLREAVGMNKPGKPFSFPMLVEQGPVKVQVTVFESKRTGDPMNGVKYVQKAA